MTRLAAAGLALLLTAVAVPAEAQLGRELDDPAGRATTLRREPPPPVDYGEVAVPPPGVAPARTPVALRLRALESTFQSLGARGPDYTGTVLSMLGGGITVGLAAVLLELGEPWSWLAPYYMVMGGVGVVRPAVVDFFLQPDARSAAIEFQHMPGSTEAEQRRRLAFGEEQLERLAEQSFIARVVDASMNILGALAVIPAYLVPRLDGTFGAMDFQPLEAFVFVGPAITLVSAIIGLATQSPAEQRWDAYREMRRRLADD